MAIVNGYCSTADVRSQLTDTAGKLDAALIEKAISAASRAIDRYCGRRFWRDSVPVARVFDVCDPCRLTVDDIATTAGLAVAVDSGNDGTFSTSWTNADFQLRPLNADANGGAYAWWEIVTVGGRYFPPSRLGRPSVRVTATWGWSSVPDEVSSATILKATSLFKRRDAPFGVAGFTDFGAVRITKQDPDVINLLAPFIVSAVA